MTMVMPLPLRCKYQITRFHIDLIATNSSEGTRAFNDESNGKRSMPMSRSNLARVDQLQSGIECVCRKWCSFTNGQQPLYDRPNLMNKNIYQAWDSRALELAVQLSQLEQFYQPQVARGECHHISKLMAPLEDSVVASP